MHQHIVSMHVTEEQARRLAVYSQVSDDVWGKIQNQVPSQKVHISEKLVLEKDCEQYNRGFTYHPSEIADVEYSVSLNGNEPKKLSWADVWWYKKEPHDYFRVNFTADKENKYKNRDSLCCGPFIKGPQRVI